MPLGGGDGSERGLGRFEGNYQLHGQFTNKLN